MIKSVESYCRHMWAELVTVPHYHAFKVSGLHQLKCDRT